MNELKKILFAIILFGVVQVVASAIAAQLDLSQIGMAIFAAGVVGMKGILDAREAKEARDA